MATATIQIPQDANLSNLIGLLIEEGKRRDAAQELADEHEANEKALHEVILVKLQETGVDRVAYAGYTAKREEAVYGNIKDYDTFIKWVHRNKYWHMLERRLAVLAFREMLGIKGAVPGVEPVTKVKLSFRKNPS